MLVRTLQNDTVDAVCWRHLGTTRDVVEQTLELNPGLAEHGTVLPHGLLIELPERPKAPAPKPTTSLWD
ncbi:phage tail protein [Achromobacter insolitus]|uniref:tail protein X n=1 Tax=Achromobacter insolitus TaxID=217204 RepID=UPI0007C638EF|nr:tail protein X [Achromobacter insolitus]APX77285.1 phage tail protein [Achromobacter insolitus]OAE63677.1 phage tail protein [Achromobacter insolitus]OWT55001.1 phage tail protein [Achromobacter insolitus]CAB3678277.1 hypothetical protein LMG6003_01461 [Achromobacter insolitus]VEG72331.1 Phage Tail Protein X [Achromobacter insolitus]